MKKIIVVLMLMVVVVSGAEIFDTLNVPRKYSNDAQLPIYKETVEGHEMWFITQLCGGFSGQITMTHSPECPKCLHKEQEKINLLNSINNKLN